MAAPSLEFDSPRTRRRVGGRVRGALLGRREAVSQELLALGQGVRIGRDLAHVVDPGARARHEVQVDIEDHLALDIEVHVEDQPVDGGADGPLDGVFDRDEAELGLPAGHGLEDGGDGRFWVQIGPREVGLGHERLVGEGGVGPEIGDCGRGRVHPQAG